MRSTHDYEPTHEDVLIGRVVDHEATPADWARLDDLAADDPMLWARLGRAQRAHAGLRIAVEDAIAGAELVDIPGGRLHERGRRSVAGRILSFAGWTMAAVLGLMLVNPSLSVGKAQPGTVNTAGLTLLSQASPDEAYSQYVARGMADGRVVSEMPTLVLEQRELPEGAGTEVFVVRRIVERLSFDRMENFTFMPDEFGQPQLTPTQPLAVITTTPSVPHLPETPDDSTPEPSTPAPLMDF